MGADYYSRVALGVRLHDKAISDCIDKYNKDNTTMKRGCSHSVPENDKFCSECGRPNWVEDVPDLSVYEVMDDIFKGSLGEEFGYRYTTDQEEYVVVVERFCSSQLDLNYGPTLNCISIPSDEEVKIIKAKLMELLEPLGLWDENQFGIWNIGYCSY